MCYGTSSFLSRSFRKKICPARQHCSGNFYIDIGDVIAAAKVQQLHQLSKHNIIPHTIKQSACDLCKTPPASEDLEHQSDLTVDDSQQHAIIRRCNVLKLKIVYIAGFITRKFLEDVRDDTGDDSLT